MRVAKEYLFYGGIITFDEYLLYGGDITFDEYLFYGGFITFDCHFLTIFTGEPKHRIFDLHASCFWLFTDWSILKVFYELLLYIPFTCFKVLKKGGYWINLGPLLYHFSDIPGDLFYFYLSTKYAWLFNSVLDPWHFGVDPVPDP